MGCIRSWFYYNYNPQYMERIRFVDPAKYLKWERKKKCCKKCLRLSTWIAIIALLLGGFAFSFYYHATNGGWPFGQGGCKKNDTEPVSKAFGMSPGDKPTRDICEELGLVKCQSENRLVVDGLQCVNQSLFCNDVVDCKNGGDENGCLRLSSPGKILNSKYNEADPEGYLYMKLDGEWSLFCDTLDNFAENGLRICQHFKFTRVAAFRVEYVRNETSQVTPNEIRIRLAGFDSKILADNRKSASKLSVIHRDSPCEVLGYLVCE